MKKGDSRDSGLHRACCSFSIGKFELVSDSESLIRIEYSPDSPVCHSSCPLLRQCISELREYLSGKRREFTIPVSLQGLTSFSESVLSELISVPYGETVTYAELAVRSGHPHAARAVGNVMHRNPVPIIVPCHRVIAAGRRIGGFGMGIRLKRDLLALEGVML